MFVVICTTGFNNIFSVQANLTSSIPPKVTAPKMNVNATVVQVNDNFQVNVDAEYQMHTVYGLGDSYVTQNWGFGLTIDPSPYVTVTVTQDTLEAHYPIPSNASNISVKINGQETEWRYDKGTFHLFGTNIPQINWTISHVPRDFNVRIHYEEPISRTIENYEYLGDYAFTLPLYGRYGCSLLSYPLYDWVGYPPTEYNIQIQSTTPNITIYSINNRGTLNELNTTSLDGTVKATFTHESGEPTVAQGGVAFFNTPAKEKTTFPTITVIIASILIMAIVVFVYFKNLHKKQNTRKFSYHK